MTEEEFKRYQDMVAVYSGRGFQSARDALEMASPTLTDIGGVLVELPNVVKWRETDSKDIQFYCDAPWASVRVEKHTWHIYCPQVIMVNNSINVRSCLLAAERYIAARTARTAHGPSEAKLKADSEHTLAPVFGAMAGDPNIERMIAKSEAKKALESAREAALASPSMLPCVVDGVSFLVPEGVKVTKPVAIYGPHFGYGGRHVEVDLFDDSGRQIANIMGSLIYPEDIPSICLCLTAAKSYIESREAVARHESGEGNG